MSIRTLPVQSIESDLVVVGGGLAGTCAAITASRLGLKVVLVQDRPILGGNSSSEIRLWVLGASCFGRSHNRYSRESGVIGELLIENRYRNPEGNPVIWDTILLEWANRESNLTLLLDTAAHSVKMEEANPSRIQSVQAYSSISQTMWNMQAPFFLDASGDGILGYLSGADYRMGRESRQEYNEKFAPENEDRCLLGSSIYFMSKDAGYPVRFFPPDFALDLEKTDIPKFRRIKPTENGPEFWWIEYGGLLDTIQEAHAIKWELWRIVYGVWDYIKNSGRYENTENLTLEWVGLLPGKRESRRFIGDYVLNQNDIVEQRRFYDAVVVGGWPIDLHPVEGVYSGENACTQEHPDGVYTIPYRCYYSKNIENLFFAGRIISCSHIAFGSTRVMATCAAGGQVTGAAAFLCHHASLQPSDLSDPSRIQQLQRLLLREHQDIHWLKNHDPYNAASIATVTASSERLFDGCRLEGDARIPLKEDLALMFPVVDRLDTIELPYWAEVDTELSLGIYKNGNQWNYIPNNRLWEGNVTISKGEHKILRIDPRIQLDSPAFLWLIIRNNEQVVLYQSPVRSVGVIAKKPEHPRHLHHHYEGELIWKPRKINVAFSIEPAQRCYAAYNVVNGYARPYIMPNCWSSAAIQDDLEWIELEWDTPKHICEIDVVCNSDLDNPLETILTRHPNRVLAENLKEVEIWIENIEGKWHKVNHIRDNHHALIRTAISLQPVKKIRIICHNAHEYPFADIYEIRAYEKNHDAYWQALLKEPVQE